MDNTNDTPRNLKEKGWAVVHDVLPPDLCEELSQEMKEYFTQLNSDGSWPDMHRSLVHDYRASHLRAAWQCRLSAASVFARIWGTEKLLSSLDAVSISRPPELGEEEFSEGSHLGWLHMDQGSRRRGLHCYQGAVYLQPCDTEDFCTRVLEGSHLLHEQFMKQYPVATIMSKHSDYCRLHESQLAWYISQGCQLRRVSVPQGSMLLWDSRTVHDNAKPMKGRPEPRWRQVCFVAMTPATWASEEDYAEKRDAYKQMQTTNHWPSQGVGILSNDICDPKLRIIKELPEIAKSHRAKQLAGVEGYECDSSGDDGPEQPEFVE